MDSFQADLMRRLDSLECHFTWKLGGDRGIQEMYLEDLIRHSCAWKGHLYNLLGYFKTTHNTQHHNKGSAEKALVHLRQAEVVLKEQEPEGRGPRLLVNQANLAWVHYHLEELPECQRYLEEVARLQEDFPAPLGCELHPEVYGEKGWTQVKFDFDLKKKAVANFEMALRGDPDRKEWHVGLAMSKYEMYFDKGDEKVKEQILKQINIAKTKDPDNLCMSVIYWKSLVDVGRKKEEAMRAVHDLAQRLKPDIEGLRDILNFFRFHDSVDSALQVAEEIVKRYPSERRAKRNLAVCYKWKIFDKEKTDSDLSELMRRGIDIYEEVTSLYPYYHRAKIDLAGMYAKSGNVEKSDETYNDLLSKTGDMEPAALQLLYHKYGCQLNFRKSFNESIDYHKKAAEIPIQSWERDKSIKILKKIGYRSKHSRCNEIHNFLSDMGLD